MSLQTIGTILLPNLISRFISIFADMDDEWYDFLEKSPLTPPGYVFGLVWPLLYLSLGYVLSNLQPNNPASQFFYLNLLLNFSWIYVYNKLRSIQGGFIIILLMVLSLVAFFYLNPQKELNTILLPYLAWLLFAGYLSYYIYQNN